MLAVAGRSCYLQCFALTPAQPKRSNWGRCQVLQPAISIATSLLLLLGRHSLQWLILNQKQRISRRCWVAQMRSWICWMECPRKLRYSCGSSWKASKQTAWFYGSASSSITSKKICHSCCRGCNSCLITSETDGLVLAAIFFVDSDLILQMLRKFPRIELWARK